MDYKKPNILIIITDQQRYDSLGCYGADCVETPNLDKLAGEGMLFKNCYVNNPICTPSRASIFTGKSLPGHGVYRLHDILPKDEVLFTKHLQGAGYKTALFGKLHVSGRIYEAANRHPNDGFNVYKWCMEPSIHMDSPFNGYSRWLKENHIEFYRELKDRGRDLKHIPVKYHFTHWAAEETINFIEHSDTKDGDKPFFCMMSVFDPHNPYDDYPTEMLKFIRADKIPEPLVSGFSMEERPDAVNREMEHSYLGSFNDFSREDLLEIRKGYYASIALIDIEVGRVLDALKKKGIENNTLVVFTSDHGDMLGDHKLLVKGAFFYEPSVKVPLILRWPKKIPAGEKSDSLVQLNDLAATVLSAAGLGEETIAGLMPESNDLTSGKAEKYPVVCYRNTGINDRGEYWNPPIYGTMIRKNKYKMSYYHSEKQGELYNLEDDPLEQHNLWGKKAALPVRNDLMEELNNWFFKQESKGGSRGGSAFPGEKDRVVNVLH